MSEDVQTAQAVTARPQWKSRLGFVLAASGSAVGLGNIWKFPYITGENGGGLFVLIYLVCILLVGLPIMMAEIMIGRAAQKQPIGAFETLQGHKTPWSGIGWLGVGAGFIILSFYIVVAGWALDYTLKSVVNFTKPVETDAVTESQKYIASTSFAQMKELLIDQEAEQQMAPILVQLNKNVLKKDRSLYTDYKAAIAEADDPAEAKRRLLFDQEMAASVTLIEEIEKKAEAEKSKLLKKIHPRIEELSEVELVKQASEMKRRSIIMERMQTIFGNLASNGWHSLMWATLFMLLTIGVVAGGVSAGIERACKILMPTLLVLICSMVVYGAFQPGFTTALNFVFSPDPSKLKPSGVLEALGHAFFTLSLGMGAMMTYGSYQQSKGGLLQESVMITLLDTLIALLACMMIFPITFSYGLAPSGGPGLVFMSMPLAFAEIGTGGMLLSILFFGLLFFAALTSAISLLEVVASYLIDQKGWTRPKAAVATGLITLLVGIPTAFSGDPDSVLAHWKGDFGIDFFDTMDHLASNWMLPLGGLFIAIYAGWAMPRKLQEIETEDMPGWAFQGWLLLVRFIAPALVILVLLQKVGILDADTLYNSL